VKTLYVALALSGLAVFSGRVEAASLQALPESACVPITRGPMAFRLSDEWAPFSDQTRVCALRRTAADRPFVFLVSVFVREYFDRHVEVKDRPAFPPPRLVDREGRCLAQLVEQFPFDPPRDLSVRYGAWRSNVPTEIRVLVSNPAAGGDYELPRLRWDAAAKSYRPDAATDSSVQRSMRCPT
jgi:hypothetical protein